MAEEAGIQRGGGRGEVEHDGRRKERAGEGRSVEKERGSSSHFAGVEGGQRRGGGRAPGHLGRRVGACRAFLNLCPRMPLIMLICNASNPLIAHRSQFRGDRASVALTRHPATYDLPRSSNIYATEQRAPLARGWLDSLRTSGYALRTGGFRVQSLRTSLTLNFVDYACCRMLRNSLYIREGCDIH